MLPFTPKAFDLPCLPRGYHGRLVEKATLDGRSLARTPSSEEANLAFQISALRKLLEDDGNGDSLIETGPTRGYRFVGGVNPGHTPVVAPVLQTRWRSWKMGLWAISLAAVIVVAVVVLNRLRADRQVPRVTIAVLPFEHLGGPEREYRRTV